MTKKLLKLQNHTAEFSHGYVIEVLECENIRKLKEKTRSVCITTEDFFKLKDDYIINNVLKITNTLHTFDDTFIKKYEEEFEFGVGVYKHMMIQKSKKLLHEKMISENTNSESKTCTKDDYKKEKKMRKKIKNDKKKVKLRKNQNETKDEQKNYSVRLELKKSNKEREYLKNNDMHSKLNLESKEANNQIENETKNTLLEPFEKQKIQNGASKNVINDTKLQKNIPDHVKNTAETPNDVNYVESKQAVEMNSHCKFEDRKETKSLNDIKKKAERNETNDDKENYQNTANHAKKYRLPKIKEIVKKEEENTKIKPLKLKKEESDDFF